jgi:hypothetical protein
MPDTKMLEEIWARVTPAHVVEAPPVDREDIASASEPTPPTLARIEHDYAALARSSAEGIRLAEEEDRLREAAEANETALLVVEKQIEAARAALVHSILEACPRPIPSLNQWHKLAQAPWQVRSGNRIFALVPAKDADIPTEADELPEAVTLAVIELDPS